MGVRREKVSQVARVSRRDDVNQVGSEERDQVGI